MQGFALIGRPLVTLAEPKRGCQAYTGMYNTKH